MKTKITPILLCTIAEFIAVSVLSVVFKVEFYNALPLLISAVVMFMQTGVSRYAFLVGGINSVLYSLVYFSMELYSGALSAIAISFPLQILTFVNWTKNTRRGKTDIKCFSKKGRLLLFVGMAAVWVVLYGLFSVMDSPYILFDNTVTVIGMASTFLCLFRYSEYSVFQIVSSTIRVVLFVNMTADDPSRIIWLIHSVYCVICAAATFRKTHKGIRSER